MRIMDLPEGGGDALEMTSVGSKRSRPSSTMEDYGVPLEDRVCPFCFMGHQEGLEFSKDFIDILNDNTVWATDKPTFTSNGKSGKPYWVHSVCVIFCPLTRFDETTNSWLGVSREYHRARCLTCVECKKKGASIGCEVPTCNASCHFPCAIKAVIPESGEKNWFPCQDPGTPFFCAAHRDERAQRILDGEIGRLDDLSRGREAVAIPLKQGLADVGADSPVNTLSRGQGADASATKARALWQLLMKQVPLPQGIRSKTLDANFTYVEATVGSGSAALRQGFERSKRCCSCYGPNACRDPRECECLRDGRNYQRKGQRLDDGNPALIYECNLNCRCHPKSCRNRLVQKGMTCKIEVAYLGPSRRLLEGCDKKWGVRASENITVGTFVCKLAGQIVSASAVEGGVDEHGEHSSVLVHRVKDWAGELMNRAGSGEDKPVSPRHEELFLDQRRYANISRYIRCSRRPEDANLVGVAVLTEDQDPTAPVMALFAGTNIGKGTELVRNRLLTAGAGGLLCAPWKGS